MTIVKCVEIYKEKNKIIGYKLIDVNGETRDIDSESLKQAIRTGQIIVHNLTMASNGVLMHLKDRDDHDLRIVISNMEKKLKQEAEEKARVAEARRIEEENIRKREELSEIKDKLLVRMIKTVADKSGLQLSKTGAKKYQSYTSTKIWFPTDKQLDKRIFIGALATLGEAGFSRMTIMLSFEGNLTGEPLWYWEIEHIGYKVEDMITELEWAAANVVKILSNSPNGIYGKECKICTQIADKIRENTILDFTNNNIIEFDSPDNGFSLKYNTRFRYEGEKVMLCISANPDTVDVGIYFVDTILPIPFWSGSKISRSSAETFRNGVKQTIEEIRHMFESSHGRFTYDDGRISVFEYSI